MYVKAKRKSFEELEKYLLSSPFDGSETNGIPNGISMTGR